MVTSKYDYWTQIKQQKPDAKLLFVHTPKCGGTYTSFILKNLGIKYKEHNHPQENEGIAFTIIRDPVERFESLLNYRLGEKEPRSDWPKQLHYVYKNKDITLNQIVNEMTDVDMVSFFPYKSLTYWSKNIDIFITIDQLQDFLNFFGYNYDPQNYVKKNVSNKVRGTLDEKVKDRIAKIYGDDILLYNTVIFK